MLVTIAIFALLVAALATAPEAAIKIMLALVWVGMLVAAIGGTIYDLLR